MCLSDPPPLLFKSEPPIPDKVGIAPKLPLCAISGLAAGGTKTLVSLPNRDLCPPGATNSWSSSSSSSSSLSETPCCHMLVKSIDLREGSLLLSPPDLDGSGLSLPILLASLSRVAFAPLLLLPPMEYALFVLS